MSDHYTSEQVAAARLRLVLDEKLKRATPDLVHRIAASPGTEDEQRARARR